MTFFCHGQQIGCSEEKLRKKAMETKTDKIPCKAVKYSRFVDLWNQYVPFIVISKPSSDLCGTCRENTRRIKWRWVKKRFDCLDTLFLRNLLLKNVFARSLLLKRNVFLLKLVKSSLSVQLWFMTHKLLLSHTMVTKNWSIHW